MVDWTMYKSLKFSWNFCYWWFYNFFSNFVDILSFLFSFWVLHMFFIYAFFFIHFFPINFIFRLFILIIVQFRIAREVYFWKSCMTKLQSFLISNSLTTLKISCINLGCLWRKNLIQNVIFLNVNQCATCFPIGQHRLKYEPHKCWFNTVSVFS